MNDNVTTTQPLFPLGQVVATHGALQAITDANGSLHDFLGRHIHGDWGVVGPEDAQANKDAVKDGSRILSAYDLSTDVRIWIITEADRSSTCILLPEEY